MTAAGQFLISAGYISALHEVIRGYIALSREVRQPLYAAYIAGLSVYRSERIVRRASGSVCFGRRKMLLLYKIRR